jgi:hypothetical protein
MASPSDAASSARLPTDRPQFSTYTLGAAYD